MRFLLDLEIIGKERLLPFNYQYPISAWIYKTIHEGNHAFASFLHNKGFGNGSKSYKLFTFSQFTFPPKSFRVAGNRMQLLSDSARITLSFFVPEAMQSFIAGLFQQQEFGIGDRESAVRFKVRQVESLPAPNFTAYGRFACLSPIMVSSYRLDRKQAQYLKPDHADYERIFFDNLARKYAAALQAGLIENSMSSLNAATEMRLVFKEPVKKKGIIVKTGTAMQTQIIGYMFDFEVWAPPELLLLGYCAGFGEKNSLGMGCVKQLEVGINKVRN